MRRAAFTLYFMFVSISVLYANPCEGLLEASVILSAAPVILSPQGEGSPTSFLITYLSRLLDETLIGDVHLVRFAEGLERGQIINPISEQEARANYSLLVQRGGLEQMIQSDTLDREALSVWAQETLSERGIVRVQRKVVHKDTQIHFQPMEFVLIPDQSYSMSRFQTTQWQWAIIMEQNPSHFKDGTESVGVEIKGRVVQMRPDHPVEQVSWDDAQRFIERLNALSRADDPLIYKVIPDHAEGEIYRLPTEAEWALAAKAGMATVYSFGNDEALLEQYAWFNKNSNNQTHAVGLKEPNPLGLYDMHGNVWELTLDQLLCSERVSRGGSWDSFARGLQTTNRFPHCSSGYISNAVGFRIMRVASQ